MPAPRDWKGGKMPRSSPGGGRGAGRSWNWHSISNNDGEGYESVTKKVNSRRFKPFLGYSMSSYFVKFWQMFLELNSKGMHQSSGKQKGSFCLMFPSSTKRDFKHLHVIVVQWRQRNVQKGVMHVHCCCVDNLNPLLFCCCRRRWRWRRRRRRCLRRLSSLKMSNSTRVPGKS